MKSQQGGMSVPIHMLHVSRCLVFPASFLHVGSMIKPYYDRMKVVLNPLSVRMKSLRLFLRVRNVSACLINIFLTTKPSTSMPGPFPSGVIFIIIFQPVNALKTLCFHVVVVLAVMNNTNIYSYFTLLSNVPTSLMMIGNTPSRLQRTSTIIEMQSARRNADVA